jgi:tRNA dimethylallyltransferase
MLPSDINPLLVILGPTASGKTAFAANLAYLCKGEIISADSRQVYKDMNLGTGKDYADYFVKGNKIPYHLIDIIPPGEKYNVFEYQNDFWKIYSEVIKRNNLPVLCGGSGLYIDAVISKYNLVQVPLNPELSEKLVKMNMEELILQLGNLRKLHNKTDILERKRLIRAIEIETFQQRYAADEKQAPGFQSLIFGLWTEVNIRRKRITERLHTRLKAGMIDEVKNLIDKGLTPEQLIYYGLEYKYITLYLTGKIGYEEMLRLLNIAIHQFAKRQMTWFRKMERSGAQIHWLDATLSIEKNLEIVLPMIRNTLVR